MGTVDIRLNGARETFEVKKKLLGLDTKKQVELLNKLYDGLLTFKILFDNTVSLDIIEENVRILEIPECDNLDANMIHTYNCKELITLKLPKTVKSININKFRGQHNLKNIWIWDTTEIKRDGLIWENTNINVFIRHTESDKVDIHRNM